MPRAALGINNFKVCKSKFFLNLYTATMSDKIKIGKTIAKAWPSGITTVINGMDIKAIEPLKPDLAIPYKMIAGTTVTKNKKFISM